GNEETDEGALVNFIVPVHLVAEAPARGVQVPSASAEVTRSLLGSGGPAAEVYALALRVTSAIVPARTSSVEPPMPSAAPVGAPTPAVEAGGQTPQATTSQAIDSQDQQFFLALTDLLRWIRRDTSPSQEKYKAFKAEFAQASSQYIMAHDSESVFNREAQFRQLYTQLWHAL